MHFKVESNEKCEEISPFINMLCVRYPYVNFFKVRNFFIDLYSPHVKEIIPLCSYHFRSDLFHSCINSLYIS